MYIYVLLIFLNSNKILFKLKDDILSKIPPVCHMDHDANRIKPGSNWKMTDKHATEYSRTAFLGVN